MDLNKGKSGVAIVIGGPRPSKSDDAETESDEPMSAGDEGMRAAVKDLFAAFDQKDIEAGVKALRAAITCVDPDQSDEGEEDAGPNHDTESKY